MSRRTVPILAKSIVGLPALEEFELFYDSENSYHLTGVKNIGNVKIFYDYEDPSGGDQGMLAPARLASIGNIDLAIAPANYDGVPAVIGDRIFVNEQTDPIENGVYIFNGAGVPLTRAEDFDTSSPNPVIAGMLIVVTEGLTLADTLWELTTNDPIIVGTTPINFAEVIDGMQAWKLNGNIVTAEKFIGTLDNFDFPIRVNNREALRVIKGATIADTKIVIGQFTGTAKLDIKGAGNTLATLSLNIINSVSDFLLSVRDDGNVGVRNGNALYPLHVTANNNSDFGIYVPRSNGNANAYAIYSPVSANAAGDTNGIGADMNSSNAGTRTRAIIGNVSANGGVNNLNIGVTGNARNGDYNYGVKGEIGAGFAVVPSETYAIHGLNNADMGLLHYAGFLSTDISILNSVGYGIDAECRNLGGGTSVAIGARFKAIGATTNYAIVTDGGNVGFGTLTPNQNAILELVSTTQALLLPRLDETAIVTPVNGMIIYNSVTDKFRGYENGAWVDFV